MDMEGNIRDKMLVDEAIRKTIEEDEKLVCYQCFCCSNMFFSGPP